jgi:hypothetical protein
MKRALYIASGIAVLSTTLAFAHLMEHHIAHEISAHSENLTQCLIAAALSALVVVLSLIGAYFLLTARRQSSRTTSPPAQD